MRQRKIEFFIWTSLILAGWIMSCSTNNDSLSENSKEPAIDFMVVGELDKQNMDYNQVMLRIQLLHTNTDILKFGISTPGEHQARLNYYLLEFKEDIQLVSKGDTIPCYDVHVERLYMDLPYMNFILTFDHVLSSSDVLIIHDGVYTNKTIIAAIRQKGKEQ